MREDLPSLAGVGRISPSVAEPPLDVPRIWGRGADGRDRDLSGRGIDGLEEGLEQGAEIGGLSVSMDHGRYEEEQGSGPSRANGRPHHRENPSSGVRGSKDLRLSKARRTASDWKRSWRNVKMVGGPPVIRRFFFVRSGRNCNHPWRQKRLGGYNLTENMVANNRSITATFGNGKNDKFEADVNGSLVNSFLLLQATGGSGGDKLSGTMTGSLNGASFLGFLYKGGTGKDHINIDATNSVAIGPLSQLTAQVDGGSQADNVTVGYEGQMQGAFFLNAAGSRRKRSRQSRRCF